MTTTATHLIIGGTGKTGSRVANRLTARGIPVRIASRSSRDRFDWNDPGTWRTAVAGTTAAYLTYHPDLALPGAAEHIASFTELAVSEGVERLVLLSGRGEPAAAEAERGVRESTAQWTVLRPSWFAQNFSENFLLDPVLHGLIALPAGDVREPFIDIDDLADVAVLVLTEPGHHGRIYELTGPRLLGFADAATEIGRATGRRIEYRPVTPEQFTAEATAAGLPAEQVAPLTELFTTILDGRNAHLTDTVSRLLGRPARDFSDYARDAAATGVWADRH